MLERHVVRQLTAYCHHELTAAESSRVQQHLESLRAMPARVRGHTADGGSRQSDDVCSRRLTRCGVMWFERWTTRRMQLRECVRKPATPGFGRAGHSRWQACCWSALLGNGLVLLAAEPTFLGSSPPRRQAQGGMERYW